MHIVHDDDPLVVIFKPAGVATHGGAGQEKSTAVGLTAELLGVSRVFPVHRLDKTTSGLMMLSRTAEGAQAVSARWSQADKLYLGVAFGRYEGPSRIELPLDDKEGRHHAASTEVEVLTTLDAVEPTTLLAVSLGTGRMHQIRRHLADVGHPIVFDDKHGDFRLNKDVLKRVKAAGARPARKSGLLHAAALRVPHPHRSKPVCVTTPPGTRWTSVLDVLAGETATDVHRAITDRLSSFASRDR